MRHLNLAEGAEIVRELLSGLRAVPRFAGGQQLESPERHGWDVEVAPLLTEKSVVRLDDTHLRIFLPQAARFDLLAPQAVELTIPAAAVLSNERIAARNTLQLRAEAGYVRLSGSLLDGTEVAVQTGASLFLTLHSDAWAADIGHAGEATEALLEGIRASGTEPTGWTAIVTPQLASNAFGRYSNVWRLNDTTIRLDVRAPAYEITAPEMLSFVIPSIALASKDANCTVYPSLSIASTPGALTFAGGLCNVTMRTVPTCEVSRFFPARRMGESCNLTLSDERVCLSRDTWVRTGLASSAPWSSREGNEINTGYFNATLELRLSNDSFVPAVGARTAEGDAATAQFLAGLLSDQNEEGGWNQVIRPRLAPSMLQRVDAQTLVLNIGPVPEYRIAFPETIGMRVPASLLVSEADLEAAMTIEISATPVSRGARLSGTLVTNGDEILVRSAGADVHVVISLENDTFALLPGYERALVAGFRSLATVPEAGGWDAVLAPALTRDLDAYLVDNRTMRLGFPQAAAYDITAPEAIAFIVPAAVLASRRELEAVPTLLILAEPGRASVTGTLLEDPNELTLQMGRGGASGTPLTLQLELIHDTWVDWQEQGNNPLVRTLLGLPAGAMPLPLPLPEASWDAVIDAITSVGAAGGLGSGWSATVTPVLRAAKDAAIAAQCLLLPFNSTNLVEDLRWVSGIPYAVNVSAPDPFAPRAHAEIHYVNRTIFAPCPTDLRIVALDAHTLSISLPPIAAYNISEPESVLVTVPASIARSGRSYAAWPPLVLLPQRGSAVLERRDGAGSSLLEADETLLRANATSLVIRLEGDEWVESELSGMFEGLTSRALQAAERQTHKASANVIEAVFLDIAKAGNSPNLSRSVQHKLFDYLRSMAAIICAPTWLKSSPARPASNMAQ